MTWLGIAAAAFIAVAIPMVVVCGHELWRSRSLLTGIPLRSTEGMLLLVAVASPLAYLAAALMVPGVVASAMVLFGWPIGVFALGWFGRTSNRLASTSLLVAAIVPTLYAASMAVMVLLLATDVWP